MAFVVQLIFLIRHWQKRRRILIEHLQIAMLLWNAKFISGRVSMRSVRSSQSSQVWLQSLQQAQCTEARGRSGRMEKISAHACQNTDSSMTIFHKRDPKLSSLIILQSTQLFFFFLQNLGFTVGFHLVFYFGNPHSVPCRILSTIHLLVWRRQPRLERPAVSLSLVVFELQVLCMVIYAGL